MITVACLATILFFGGWLSPFPQTAALCLDALSCLRRVLLIAGVALIVARRPLHYGFGRIALPVLGVVLCALAVFCTRPGVIECIQGPILVSGEDPRDPFRLRLGALDAAALSLRSADGFGWKLLLPLALLNVVLTSLAVVTQMSRAMEMTKGKPSNTYHAANRDFPGARGGDRGGAVNLILHAIRFTARSSLIVVMVALAGLIFCWTRNLSPPSRSSSMPARSWCSSSS